LDVRGPVSTSKVKVSFNASRKSCVIVREGYVDGKVVRRKFSGCVPFKDRSNVCGAQGEVRRCFRTVGRESCWGLLIEEKEVAVIKSINQFHPPGSGSLVGGGGKPGRIVGVEVSNNHCVICRVKEFRKVRVVTRRAG
jgi:hypothetical protein